MSVRHVDVFKVATTTPGLFVVVRVRYPTYRPRGFVLEVEPHEEYERDGITIVTRTFAVGRPDDSREAALAPASRFNARAMEKLAQAVRTLGTPERAVAEREYRAFMTSSGYVAQFSPFGDA